MIFKAGAVISPMNKRKNLWQLPWRYRESAVFLSGIIVTGFALQLVSGPFRFSLLQYPVNLGLAVIFLALIPAGYRLRRTWIAQWLSGIPFSVCLIGALLLFGLVMGLIPQVATVDPHAHSLVADLGFTRVTTSWPFVLLYGLTLVSLSLVLARRLGPFRKKDLALYCNHAGLLLLLLAAGLGAADMRRFVMHVREGEVEWRVYSADNTVLELPIAIKLKNFSMEEYPPKLVIINRQTGVPQPEGRPWSFQLDVKKPHGALGDWRVTLEEYIHEAVRMGDGYKASPMPASTPAARVTVRNARDGGEKSGWISGGGAVPGFFSALPLDDALTMVMTRPEPKRFVSEITVLTRDGQEAAASLEVNKPLTVGDWMIYQYGYDAEAGKISSYSSMELVYDPWLVPAYLGMGLMLLGSCCLIWRGSGRRRENAEETGGSQ